MKLPSTRKEALEKGLTRYFTNKPCHKGHICERRTANCQCVACGKGYINPTKKKQRHQRWRDKNRDHLVEAGRLRYKDKRTACIAMLGGKCACCGDIESVFLCIDHRNGDGNVHRRTVGQSQIVGWLFKQVKVVGIKAIRNNYRVLCWNCNSAFHILGYCPHHPRRK